MHILLTGASGHVGSHTLIALLAWTKVERITAVDIVPLPPRIAQALEGSSGRATFSLTDLTNPAAVDELFTPKAATTRQPVDAVIHLGGVPNPETMDHRLVHNINVTSNYNVLHTATLCGVKRICQASSVNAIGLSYTPAAHRWFNAVPLDEDTPRKPEDPYALSKYITEIQADAQTRLFPDVRVASLRFHMVRPSYSSAWPDAEIKDLWGWVSYASAARACILALTSEGWKGHEVFNIVAPRICYESETRAAQPGGGGGGEANNGAQKEDGAANENGLETELHPTSGLEIPAETGDEKTSSMELLERYWPGTEVKPGWWTEGNERRGFWDTSKAERLLGWKHEG